MVMKRIPLNALTLYADLDQDTGGTSHAPATISRRLESGQRRLYASVRDGKRLKQIYIGTAGDPAAEGEAALFKAAMEQARQRRSTVSALKRLGVPAPPLDAGRVLSALSRAGVFTAGGILVGTAAYQCYPCLVGHALPAQALITRDLNVSIARIALPKLTALDRDFNDILSEADPTFRPVMRGGKAPQSFRNSSGFTVDVLTTVGRKPEPVFIKGLAVYAVPLAYMDYLIAKPVTATALYGRGVRVTVPDPARFALHKLVIARRRVAQRQKAPKDELQASALIEALNIYDPFALADAIDAAKAKGGDLRRVALTVEDARACLL